MTRHAAPVRSEPLPAWPDYGDEEIQAAVDVLRSGRFSCLSGDRVTLFEQAFAAFNGAKHAIAIANGTAAVHAALVAAGVGPGDEVVVTPHSFIASVSPVLFQQAVPVFADIDRATFNLTPDSVEPCISDRTKAIVAVHLNGHPCDASALADLADRHGIALIEDSAQSPGATWDGQMVGTFGALATYSFWEDKILTTAGEGGMIVTDDDDLARAVRMVINHGEAPADESYYAGERLYFHERLGYNYRMTELSGAIGSVQLGRLPGYLAERARVGAGLTRRLGDVAGLETPYVDPRATHSFYKYILLLDRAVIDAPVADVVAAVRAQGVPASRRYPTPIHRQPIFERFDVPTMPVAEQVAKDAIRLPVSPGMTEADLDDIAAAVRKALGDFSNTPAG
jgi:perosamine synthetase